MFFYLRACCCAPNGRPLAMVVNDISFVFEPASNKIPGKNTTNRALTDPLTHRKFVHSPLPRQSPRRLLFPQYPHLLPSLRPRHCDLGVARLHRLVLRDLQSPPRQHPQHRSTSPLPSPQPALQRLGRILLHRPVDTHNPRLQPRNRRKREPRIRRRILFRSVQPRRRPQEQRERGIHPPNPPWRRAQTQPYHPHRCLGQPRQRHQCHCNRRKHNPPIRHLPHPNCPPRNHPLRRRNRHPPPPTPLMHISPFPTILPQHPRRRPHPRNRPQPPRPPGKHHNVGAQPARTPQPNNHGL